MAAKTQHESPAIVGGFDEGLAVPRIRPTSLSGALVALEMDPLPDKAVFEHKLREQRKHNFKSLSELSFGMRIFGFLVWLWQDMIFAQVDEESGSIIALRSAFIMVLLLVAFAAGIVSFIQGFWIATACIAPFFALSACFFFTFALEQLVTGKLLRWQWVKLDLAACDTKAIPIPQFVRYKALRLKETLPDAQVFVEILESSWATYGDPFLGAYYRRETLYVECWNEAAFERKTTRNPDDPI